MNSGSLQAFRAAGAGLAGLRPLAWGLPARGLAYVQEPLNTLLKPEPSRCLGSCTAQIRRRQEASSSLDQAREARTARAQAASSSRTPSDQADGSMLRTVAWPLPPCPQKRWFRLKSSDEGVAATCLQAWLLCKLGSLAQASRPPSPRPAGGMDGPRGVPGVSCPMSTWRAGRAPLLRAQLQATPPVTGAVCLSLTEAVAAQRRTRATLQVPLDPGILTSVLFRRLTFQAGHLLPPHSSPRPFRH